MVNVTTSGLLTVTPILIRTTATVSELLDVAARLTYVAEVPSLGWGNVDVGDEALGTSRARPANVGTPQHVAATDTWPEQFRGRLFWDQIDPRAMSLLPDSAPAAMTHFLEATDVTIASTSEDGELLALVSMRRADLMKEHVVPALEVMARLVDEGALILPDSSPIAFGDDDFFRWMLYRTHNDRDVTPEISLKQVRAMKSEDRINRGASLVGGADIDRPELLALVSGALTRFGPAKVSIYDSALGLDAELELRLNGGFSIYLGPNKTEYDEDPPRAEKGPRAVSDVAFRIIPELKRAYNSDNDWRDTLRDEFTETARRALAGALFPLGCPHCGRGLD